MIQYQLTLAFLSDKIEAMKTFIKMLLPLVLICMFASCATTSVGETSGNTHIEKKQKQEKLLFDDWKYKGFGQALPVWFEAAYNDDEEKLAKALPQLAGHKLFVIRGEGVNSDQADKVLKIKEEEIPSDYILYDSSWALFRKGKSGTYIAIAVFYN